MKRRRVKLYRVLLPKVLFWMVIALVVVVLFRSCKREEPVEVSPPVNTTFELTPPPEVDSSDESLIQAVVACDTETGMKMTNEISYTDLLNLSRIMAAESGENWPDWAIMAIGEVVMNRVASPEFPDTITEVLYQKGQYEPVYKNSWSQLRPDERTVRLAFDLLKGERVLNDPTIVFQALFEQGSSTATTYGDVALNNTTYFCRSNYPELYEKED